MRTRATSATRGTAGLRSGRNDQNRRSVVADGRNRLRTRPRGDRRGLRPGSSRRTTETSRSESFRALPGGISPCAIRSSNRLRLGVGRIERGPALAATEHRGDASAGRARPWVHRPPWQPTQLAAMIGQTSRSYWSDRSGPAPHAPGRPESAQPQDQPHADPRLCDRSRVLHHRGILQLKPQGSNI